MQYGTVINSANVNRWLQQYNRSYNGRSTFSQMYSAIDVAAQQAEASVKYDMAQDVADAYTAALKQKSNVYSAGYRSNVEQSAIDDINLTLQEAYEASLADYNTKISTIDKNASASIQKINDALNKQTQQYLDYTNKHFDYLTWLDKQIGYDALKNTEFSKYYNHVYYDSVGSKLSESELMHLIRSTDSDFEKYTDAQLLDKIRSKGYKEYSATPVLKTTEDLYGMLFDLSGNINQSGKQFFDLVENYYATSGSASEYSFGSYLSTLQNSDLLKWSMSANQYDYDSSIGRYLTNAEAYRRFVGLDATDEQYTSSENLKYASNEELNKIYTSLNALAAVDADMTLDDIQSSGFKADLQKSRDDFKQSIAKFNNILDDTSSLYTKLDEAYDYIENTYSEYVNAVDILERYEEVFSHEYPELQEARKRVTELEKGLNNAIKTITAERYNIVNRVKMSISAQRSK